MPTCVFLSMDSLGGYMCDDHLIVPYLEDMGWEVKILPWRENHSWIEYDKVVVRSTWDYQKDPELFLNTLRNIEQAGTPLYNSSKLISWNLEKTYLRDLAHKDIPIVPTMWMDKWKEKNYFEEFRTQALVFKPLVSASAQDTFLVHQNDYSLTTPILAQCFSKRAFLVQPFRTAIQSEGEYSLFYFGPNYSHCILKKPKNHDFRVQEEHGGKITALDPPKELLSLSNEVLDALPEIPLYARLDYVQNSQDSYEIMEVELIEPSMYLRFDNAAPRRFAEAIISQVG